MKHYSFVADAFLHVKRYFLIMSGAIYSSSMSTAIRARQAKLVSWFHCGTDGFYGLLGPARTHGQGSCGAHPFNPPVLDDTEKVCYSGNLVKMDEEGFLYFVGHRDNMIKCSGYSREPDGSRRGVVPKREITGGGGNWSYRSGYGAGYQSFCRYPAKANRLRAMN